jgi:hypothetical protein
VGDTQGSCPPYRGVLMFVLLALGGVLPGNPRYPREFNTTVRVGAGGMDLEAWISNFRNLRMR